MPIMIVVVVVVVIIIMANKHLHIRFDIANYFGSLLC